MTSQDDAFMQLRGVAASRAHTWVTSLLARNFRGPWNPTKALEIARRKVADLAREEMRERLARECERCARQEYSEALPAQTHDPAVESASVGKEGHASHVDATVSAESLS